MSDCYCDLCDEVFCNHTLVCLPCHNARVAELEESLKYLGSRSMEMASECVKLRTVLEEADDTLEHYYKYYFAYWVHRQALSGVAYEQWTLSQLDEIPEATRLRAIATETLRSCDPTK